MKAAAKTQKCLSVTRTKKKKLETRVRETEQKFQSNTQSFDRVKQEMTSLAASSKELENDVVNYQSHLRAELECAELRRQCRYFTKYTQAQEKDAQATERYLKFFVFYLVSFGRGRLETSAGYNSNNANSL